MSVASCGLSNGVEIHFLKSGIRIRPYELRTNESLNQYSSARVIVSRPAGELIGTENEESEPIHVIIDGTIQGRYIFQKDSLEMKKKIGRFTNR